ncbi:glycerophosphodiester phosphodiesterase [Clostridium botulinum]|uniref:glycerophosphodiester phosphodiesterase n=1 Tax=Clostridium botulinum TaxID=1491 RepID=UPI0022478B0B|nr:glycerophosphodiester phosphodiesterase [Clostridium botulinum]UZP01982.1 glycerophosphodiester phosphodiesterase [Clostridium botulinum]UZP05340.1 glycerophosphodiester phosphodiesterase [Clostridium botulinum]UZP08721.1 glycerophosphodiester phosphodiesterase [Clostridium botulinum]
MKKTLNIAHRGFSGVYPENTMLAFEKAIEVGCDGIETDVQLTKDGFLVICHDEQLDRTTTGTGLIKDFTLKELMNFDAGIKFGEEFKGLKIPTLEEFLKYVSDKNIIINIEIKNSIVDYENIEKTTYDLIKKYKLEERIIVSTFNHYSVRRCIRLDKTIKTGVLYYDCIFEPHNYVQMVGGNALHPEYHSVNKEIVEKAHDNNLEVNVYTVNDKDDMKRMMDLGVDAIITNYPNVLKELFIL